MGERRIGIDISGSDPNEIISRIQKLEDQGIRAVWLSSNPVDLDALTMISAIALRTERIMLGTSIVTTWPRHPGTVVGQIQVIAGLAPGRFRIGLGPSHKREMQDALGFDFKEPLTHLREYIHIVKALLREGKVDFEGRHYKVHVDTPRTFPDVPVMISALREGAFRLCGAEADGAISWVCPGAYLRDGALPAMEEEAKRVGRTTPPLIAHVPICVHDDPNEVRAMIREQLAYYPSQPFYANMFADAGFPEAKESGGWSDRMLDAVALSGNEDQVAQGLNNLFEIGAEEILVTVLPVGSDPNATYQRTMNLLVDMSDNL